MQLLQSWKESFNMLKSKNIKLLALVTFKSFVQAYGILLYHYWWLFVLAIAIEASCYYPECLFTGPWSYVAIKGLKIILVALMCAIARPSLMRKNRFYIVAYFSRCILPAYLLLFLPVKVVLGLGMVLLFATFFYLDSYGSMRDIMLAVVRGCTMFIYNLPACGVFTLMAFLTYHSLLKLLGIYSTYVFLLSIPLIFALVKNMYVKRLHDQFNVYYTV